MSRQRSIDTIKSSEYVTIGELARLTGSRYSTLKHYTEEGLIPYQQEGKNLTRQYKRVESVSKMMKIIEFRESGKTIAEIKVLIN